MASFGSSSSTGSTSIEEAIANLKNRQNTLAAIEPNNNNNNNNEADEKDPNVIQWKDMTKEQQEITLKRRFQNCMVYIKNLPYKIKAEDLKMLFSRFGEILNIALGNEDATLGTAFIVYKKQKQAKAAINALRGFKLRERYLIVQPYNPLTMKEKVEKQIERRREQVSNSKKSNGNAKKQRVS